MKNRKEFINKFINRYYQKSLRKRRSSKNKAYYIANTVNNVFKNIYDRKVKFDEEEIYKAFELNGFELMESTEKDFTWDKFHNNDILILFDLFINIEAQKNHDLRSVVKRSFPDTWKDETKERMELLRLDLDNFWKENKGLLGYS